jgi:hypothetical protein
MYIPSQNSIYLAYRQFCKYVLANDISPERKLVAKPRRIIVYGSFCFVSFFAFMSLFPKTDKLTQKTIVALAGSTPHI